MNEKRAPFSQTFLGVVLAAVVAGLILWVITRPRPVSVPSPTVTAEAPPPAPTAVSRPTAPSLSHDAERASPTTTSAHLAPPAHPDRGQPVFDAPSYRLRVDAVQRRGNILTVDLIIENQTSRLLSRMLGRYIVQVGAAWYVLDDQGDRWDVQGYDTAGFIADGFPLPPHAVRRTQFTFTCAEAKPTARRFTLVGFVWAQQQGPPIAIDERPVSIPDLTVQAPPADSHNRTQVHPSNRPTA